MEKLQQKATDSIEEPTLQALNKIEEHYFKNYEFDYEEMDKIEVHDDEVGAYIETLPKVKRNTLEQDKVLAERIKTGPDPEEAKRALFYSVAMMPVWQAFKRHGRQPVMELIQEANLAIWEKAIPKYNPDKYKDVKFSTYAMFWIECAQKRAIVQGSRPDHVVESHFFKAGHINNFIYQYMALNGEKPSLETIAVKFEMKPADIETILTNTGRKFLSLSQKLRPDEDLEIGETIPDPRSIFGEELEIESDLDLIRENISKEIARLPDRQAKILRWRLGIDKDGEWTNRPLSLTETGKIEDGHEKQKITRERVRQLQVSALKKFESRKIAMIVYGLLMPPRRR